MDISSSSPKDAIKLIVADYKRMFPTEYAQVCRFIQKKREMLRDDYASVEGARRGDKNLQRGLYEVPETLNQMLITRLSDEQITWLKSGGVNHKEGGRWFARTFREFALPKTI